MAKATCCSWVNTSGDAETQLCKITEQAILLKRRLLPRSFSLNYLTLIVLGFGDHRFKVDSKH